MTMPPSFLPRLVNEPLEDPGLFIPFLFEKRAILFDLGEIYNLSSRDLLKLTHIFVTHAHMDHLIGFDRLLRLFLGREKQLYLYGPEGFIQHVEGKLRGYTWNLVENYTSRFALHLTEVRTDRVFSREHACRDRFLPSGNIRERRFDGTLLAEPALTVSAIILDHGIPCLAFSLEEKMHINIMKDRLTDLGLETGRWLNAFKAALSGGEGPDSEFAVSVGKDETGRRRFALGELSKRIARITPGQKITYVADMSYTPLNVEKTVALARNSDHLFIEAAFLEKHKEAARAKFHLTARQAGLIARRAGVKQFTVFHFSPRYCDKAHLLQKEAADAFENG